MVGTDPWSTSFELREENGVGDDLSVSVIIVISPFDDDLEFPVLLSQKFNGLGG